MPGVNVITQNIKSIKHAAGGGIISQKVQIIDSFIYIRVICAAQYIINTDIIKISKSYKSFSRWNPLVVFKF